MGIPMIGCASHRLNLAVGTILQPYEDQLSKINSLIKKLGSPKKLEKRCSGLLLEVQRAEFIICNAKIF